MINSWSIVDIVNQPISINRHFLASMQKLDDSWLTVDQDVNCVEQLLMEMLTEC